MCFADTYSPESPPKYNCSPKCRHQLHQGSERAQRQQHRDRAVSCGFMALFEAWEAVGHGYMQTEPYSQCRIPSVGLGLGQARETLVAVKAGGRFLP